MSSQETIKNDVISQLVWDGRIDSSDLDIKVEDNSVTLYGKVPSLHAKNAALDDALYVVGVNMVVDNIKVEIPDIDTLSDEEIERNILNSFTLNANLKSFELTADVENSWVTLEGTVDALWKSYLAEEEAKNSSGVVGVTNAITVVPTADHTDKSISEHIKESIERDSQVQIDEINIQVENGEVRLSGTVFNYAAKSAAFLKAIQSPGVTSVINNIVVKQT